MIGLAGDIFSGMWDDSKYVAWAAEQFAEGPQEPILDTDALGKFAAHLVQLSTENATMEAVRLWYSPDVRKATLATNEAIEYVWSQLREHSALRSAIKANKPA